MDNIKSIIAAPISNDQWKKSRETSIYEQPITTAVNQCVDYMVNQIKNSPTIAFVHNDNKWEMVVPAITGQITIGNISYPFTLSSRLECEGYTQINDTFNFSRLIFYYGFQFNDFTTAHALGDIHVDSNGIVHDFQIYGVIGRNNTHRTAISFLRNELKREFPDCLQGVAQSMLQYDLNTTKNKAKSKRSKI